MHMGVVNTGTPKRYTDPSFICYAKKPRLKNCTRLRYQREKNSTEIVAKSMCTKNRTFLSSLTITPEWSNNS